MSNRLGGKQGTAYLGTNANQPPNWTFSNRDPNQYDINNVSLGDMWLNQNTEDVWILVSLRNDGTSGIKGSVATWSKIDSGGIGILDTLTGNSGGAVASTGGNINVVGDGTSINIVGNPGTSTLTASTTGIVATSFDTDAGTATPVAGVLEIIAGNAVNHTGSTVLFSGAGNTVLLTVTDANDNTIIGEGAGNATLSGGDNTVLGEESAVSLTSGSDNTIIGGTAGFGITSGSNNIVVGSGAGASLTTGSSNTLIGGIGFGTATDLLVITAGTTGVPILHNYPGSNASTTNGGNVFVGGNAGNFTLAGGAGDASNNAVGTGSLTSLTTGARNNAMGTFALTKVTTGSNNIGIGNNAGFNSGGDTGLVSGQYNVLVGYAAGDAYTGAESSNIIIGGASGTVGQSNTLIIGMDTGTDPEELNAAFIHGIRGITPTVNDGIPVFINSVGQLGTVGSGGATFLQTLTGDGAVVVSPTAGNINIVGDGSTAAVTASPGTSTLTISAIGGGGGTLNDLVGDDGIPVVPLAGIINVITNNVSQGSGSSVQFTGAVANTLTLSVSDADDNTIIGQGAGNATLSGTSNTSLGVGCLTDLDTGSENTVVGFGSGSALTTGSSNVLVGQGAGNAFLTGQQNLILGTISGSNYTTTESSNILLNSTGTIADSNKLRIGMATGTGAQELNASFIQGIRGITPATADGIPVFIGSTGQLGTVGSGGTTMVQTITGNAGGAVGPAAGNINVVGDGVTIQITGNPGTNTLTVVGLGGGGGDLSILTGDDGSTATAAAGTINVITGNATQEAGSTVLFTGAGNTLTLNVTDADDNTIIGSGSGNATLTGTNNIALGSLCGGGLTTGSDNILIGIQAGSLITTGSGNFLCGNGALTPVLEGTTTSFGLYAFSASTGIVFLHNWGGFLSGNTFVGNGSGSSFDAGQQVNNRNNTGCGINSLALLTTGDSNVAIGSGAGISITSGQYNTLIGSDAGSDYLNSESSNICIGLGTLGTTGESHVTRIGVATGLQPGQINRTFIAGIRGITTGISNAIPVVIDSAGQLGTAGGSSVITTLTADSGGPVSATAGNINIVGDGTSVNITGSPGTSTLTVSAVGGAAGPSFFAYLDATTTGIVSTVPYTIIYDTLPYNLGGDFDLGTSTFTAPVDGLYNFSCGIGILFGSGLDKRFEMKIITTGRIFRLLGIKARSGATSTIILDDNTLNLPAGNIYTNMDAGDTATCEITFLVGGTTSLTGTDPAINNFFSGQLV